MITAGAPSSASFQQRKTTPAAEAMEDVYGDEFTLDEARWRQLSLRTLEDELRDLQEVEDEDPWWLDIVE